jgi:hypothetical protein
MPYIKRIQTLINHADACGAGMKKSGLVYGSDYTRISKRILLSKTPGNIAFSVRGAMQNCCGQTPTTNLNPSQRAYRNYRTALN